MTNETDIDRLLREITALESRARGLEPDAAERERWLDMVHQYSESFLESLPERPAFCETEDKGAGLYRSAITEEPRAMSELLAHLERDVDRPGLNPASAGHLAYIPGGGLWTSALGDFLAAVTNRYAGVFYPGPGAVRMENLLLDWMRELVGYPEKTTAGNLTSGGSIGNLMGVVTARDAAELKGKDYQRSVVYLSPQVHHSVDKALRIAGLGECIKRHVPLDEGYRMRAEVLAEMIRQDEGSGKRPWLTIASAGTTDTGVIDPLDPIAELCDRHDLWLHVDGAYGVFFMLCERARARFRGIERSHSVVMDPHKGLFLPYGCGAVLVKDGRQLYDSHYFQANYMQDTLSARDELSPADLSPELSKHFRGLRLWLPLLLHGLGPFRAALEEKLLLTRYFYHRLKELPRWELGAPPELSVVPFRYLPRTGDPDAFNRQLIRAIQTDGRVFLSSTLLDDRFTLRIAIGSFRTHRDTVDLTLEILKEKVAELEAT